MQGIALIVVKVLDKCLICGYNAREEKNFIKEW